MKSKIIMFTLLAACGLGQQAFGTTIVAPNAQETLAGNGRSVNPFRFYGTGGSRFQQVYNSFLFSSFTNAELITSVAFRPVQGGASFFVGDSLTISDISVQLSTTSRVDTLSDPNGLSYIFANNIGLDVTTVYSGALTLRATPSDGLAPPYAFDYVITFTTPFVYNPTMGNLLLDILIPDAAIVSGPGSVGFRQIDTITDAFPSFDGVASARGATGSATIGTHTTMGVVTKFTSNALSVPDSGNAFLLLFPGLALMVAAQRRLPARIVSWSKP